MVTHKIDALSDKITKCGNDISMLLSGDYVTMFHINVSCPLCLDVLKKEHEEL